MNNWQSRKASIKRHQLPFLQQLADEMGYYSISDAVNYAIDEFKRSRTADHKLVTKTEPIPQPQINLDDTFGSLDL